MLQVLRLSRESLSEEGDGMVEMEGGRERERVGKERCVYTCCVRDRDRLININLLQGTSYFTQRMGLRRSQDIPTTYAHWYTNSYVLHQD